MEGHANPPRLLASFAPSVADAAIAGDPVATDIMRRAGQALAATLLAAGRDLPQPAPFVLVGGLAALGAALLDPMRAALPPGVVEAPCRGDALDGARLLAARRHGAHERHLVRHVAGPGSVMVAAERLVRQGDT